MSDEQAMRDLLQALVSAERRRTLQSLIAALPKLDDAALDELTVAIDAQRARGVGVQP